MRTRGRAAALAMGLLAGLHSARAADEPQRIAFHAEDGFLIHADYYGPTSSYNEAPFVILLHEEGRDRKTWQPLIRPLRENGFVVLAVDLRGSGESATSESRALLERRDSQLFRDMQKDVRGAYDWLAQQRGIDRARFGLIAAGSAAAVAVNYAVMDRSVDVIVSLSPTLDCPGLDLSGDLGQLRGRSILLLGAEDEKGTCDRLAARAEGMQQSIVPATAHGTDMLGQVSKLESQVLDFLIRGVGKTSKSVVYGSLRRNIYHEPGSGWIKEIDPSNLRHYSSAEEAKARGLRPAKNSGPRESEGARRERPGPQRKP